MQERGIVKIADAENLAPQEHFPQKIDESANFSGIHEMMEPLHSENEGRSGTKETHDMRYTQ